MCIASGAHDSSSTIILFYFVVKGISIVPFSLIFLSKLGLICLKDMFKYMWLVYMYLIFIYFKIEPYVLL